MPRRPAVRVPATYPDPAKLDAVLKDQAQQFALICERLREVPLFGIGREVLGYVDQEKLASMVEAAWEVGGSAAVGAKEARRLCDGLARLVPTQRPLFRLAQLETKAVKRDTGSSLARRLQDAEAAVALHRARWANEHRHIHELFGDLPCKDLLSCSSRRKSIRRHAAALQGLDAMYTGLAHDAVDTMHSAPEGERGWPDYVHTMYSWGCSFRELAFVRLWILGGGRTPVVKAELDSLENTARKAHQVRRGELRRVRHRLLGARWTPDDDDRREAERKAKAKAKLTTTPGRSRTT